MKGRLIIIEGTDASGKSTQLRLLCDKLAACGQKVKSLSFPRYEKEFSAPVRMYLNGAFGAAPGDVNAYAASTFFAVDRYASYRSEWREYYEAGGTLIFDRYTTSNAIHQGAKLPPLEREAFFNWLFDFEYRLLGLPAPDLVLFLDMPPECSAALLRARTGKEIDIHEKDAAYRSACYQTAQEASERFQWARIDCTEGGNIKSIEQIHAEILSRIEGCFHVGISTDCD